MDRRHVTAAAIVAVIFGMVGASFAAIPLYRLFCSATGFGGTPNFTRTAGPGAAGGSVVVHMNANVAPSMPWTFAPDRRDIQAPLGEEQIAFYHGTNLANEAVSGTAVYNVTPEKVGRYFHKTACFCLSQQTLAAGATMQFPISFWVDPAIRTDPNTADVKSITLSHTFFRSSNEAVSSKEFGKAGPHVGPISDAAATVRAKVN